VNDKADYMARLILARAWTKEQTMLDSPPNERWTLADMRLGVIGAILGAEGVTDEPDLQLVLAAFPVIALGDRASSAQAQDFAAFLRKQFEWQNASRAASPDADQLR
jgi:hypothetical protein